MEHESARRMVRVSTWRLWKPVVWLAIAIGLMTQAALQLRHVPRGDSMMFQDGFPILSDGTTTFAFISPGAPTIGDAGVDVLGFAEGTHYSQNVPRVLPLIRIRGYHLRYVPNVGTAGRRPPVEVVWAIRNRHVPYGTLKTMSAPTSDTAGTPEEASIEPEPPQMRVRVRWDTVWWLARLVLSVVIGVWMGFAFVGAARSARDVRRVLGGTCPGCDHPLVPETGACTECGSAWGVSGVA